MRRGPVPGGAARGALGACSRRGSWGPRPTPSPPRPRPASPPALRGGPGHPAAGSPPSVLRPPPPAHSGAAGARRSPCPASEPRAPPPRRPAWAPQGGDGGAQVPGRRGGRLCKVAASPVTLRCRCAGCPGMCWHEGGPHWGWLRGCPPSARFACGPCIPPSAAFAGSRGMGMGRSPGKHMH